MTYIKHEIVKLVHTSILQESAKVYEISVTKLFPIILSLSVTINCLYTAMPMHNVMGYRRRNALHISTH
jgi:hypothetical protein